MRRLVVGALLAVLGSCATRRPSMEAPRRFRQQYHHRQQMHERERRRRAVLVVFHPTPVA